MNGVFETADPEIVKIPLVDKFEFVIDYAHIDSEDYPLVSLYSWRVETKPNAARYALATINGSRVYLHRLLLGLTRAYPTVSHIDGNTLNNTRHNLRISKLVDRELVPHSIGTINAAEDVVAIPLYNRYGDIRAYTQINSADLNKVNKYRWRLQVRDRQRYAQTTVDGFTTRLHRLLLGLAKGDVGVDHIDGNGLNNTRQNLRIATQADNNQNRGPCKGRTLPRGVSLFTGLQRYHAQAQLDGVSYHLGFYDTAEEADKVVRIWRAQNMPFSKDARDRIKAGSS